MRRFPQARASNAGPGERLHPRPTDSRGNDIMNWQTRLVVSNTDWTANLLRSVRVPFVSPGVIATPRAELGFRKAILVRDPDGHAVQLTEPTTKD